MAGAEPTPSGGMHVEVEAPDGPPMPPPARRRRRRRRALGIVVAIVVLGVPVSLAIAGAFPDADEPSATGDGDAQTSEDAGDDDGDAPASGDDGGPAALDLDVLEGADAVYGRLLVDIDRSEQVMIGFQDELASVFADRARSPQELLDAVREIGAERRDALLVVRTRLDDTLSEDGAETVRDRYVEHLDSWADYMGAVSEDPSVLGREGVGAGYTVVINATADAFARALETELPDDADDAVRAYADEILDRGFRGLGEAQV